MPNCDRWRRWHPASKKFEESLEQELTKLTKGGSVSFVSSDSVEIPNFSPIPVDDTPATWTEDFHRWMLEKCAFRIRSFGGIEVLFRDFRDWSLARQEAPCTHTAFGQLVASAGLFQANGLISGLVLRDDLDDTKPTEAAGMKRSPQPRA
jgi:hypothetical protein